MRIDKHFKGKRFQVNGQKYIIIIDPNSVKSSAGSLMLGYYAYNQKTHKATSIDYFSSILLKKQPEKVREIIREKLTEKIKKEKT